MCLYRSCACVFGEEKMRTYLLCIFSDFFFLFSNLYDTCNVNAVCVCARVYSCLYYNNIRSWTRWSIRIFQPTVTRVVRRIFFFFLSSSDHILSTRTIFFFFFSFLFTYKSIKNNAARPPIVGGVFDMYILIYARRLCTTM